MYGGDDGARTRDLCRDSTEASSNLLKLRVTDGFFWRSEVPIATLIGPLSDPRPLPYRLLPQKGFLPQRVHWAVDVEKLVARGSFNRVVIERS